MITVSFACNNPDNGLPTGKVAAVCIHGSCDIELEGPNYPEPSNILREVEKPVDAPDRCDRGFKLGRYTFPCYGWTSYYGNWCWDATRMTGIDVLVLLRTLRELGYRCVASDVDFGEAYDGGRELTPALVQRATAL